MTDFDRIRPPGSRSSRPGERAASGARDPAGRAALYSTPPGGGGRSPRDTLVGLELRCSRCGAATPAGARTLLRAAFPLVVVAPWRRHPVFAVCPACRHRSWLRLALAADAWR